MTESDSRKRLRSNVLDRVSDAIVSLNDNLEYTFANPQAEQLLNETEESLRGTYIWDAFPESADTVAEQTVTDALETGQEQTFERYSEALDRWFEARVYPDEDGVSIFFADISERKRRERELKASKEQIEAQNDALETFTEIVTDTQRTTSQHITDLLELGATYLDLDIGILAEIDGSEYTVRHVVDPAETIEAGDTFDLTDTYCSLVYDADGPVSFHSVDAGGVKEHPAYQKQGLESYTGVPVFVGGHRYGTLNFSRPDARETPITDTEESFVRIMAQWIGTELTHQQRQAELERTSQFLKDTQEVANVGGWEYGLRSETMRWSDEVYRIHGLPLDANPTPQEGIEFYHPDDRDTIREAFERLTTDGEPYDLELRLLTTDDEIRWVRTRGEPRYEDDEIVAVHGTLQDITERKEFQSELEQSKQIIENSTDIATIIDPQGTITYVSPAVEDVLGYEPDALIGTDGFGYQPAGTKAAVASAIEHVLDNPAETETVQTRFRRADGSWCWVESTLRNRLEDDVINGILVSSRDISERKEREQILERLVQQIDELINADNKTDIAQMATEIANAVFGATIAGVHLRSEDDERLEGVATNDLAREQFGEPPTYSRDDDDIASELVWEAFDRSRPLYLRDTEKYGPLSADSPARSALIHPLDDHGVFIVSETETDAFDATVQNLVELVAQAVTSGLNRVEREADLRESRQRIQRQNERLDQFASVVSHDLRNPLGVAQLRLNLLKEEIECEHVESIEHSLDRMETMIDDLLTMARADQTVEDGQVEQILLYELAESAWETTRTASATLELAVPDEAVVDGHRSLLRTALENLFRNALDHNDPPLTVRVGLLDAADAPTDDGHRGGFLIEDDGDGIPEDEYDDIFSYGYTTSDEGTGFGLSIVEDVVEAHGWTISIAESDEGGARFEITGVKVSGRRTDSWY
jgi:PAS domain S-box-containing protein